MSIHKRIIKTRIEFTAKTGLNPTRCYLGRGEMGELMRWAERNTYIADASTAGKEVAERPEVDGLLVFEVNAPSHLVCA